jgi:DNA phosphorothioation-dependent restriction protein DptG
MVSIHLANSLAEDAQARLLTYRKKFTFDMAKYAPRMYKIIMCIVTINSVTTTQTSHNNLQSLGMFAVTVSSNIDKTHNKFDKNYSPFLVRGCNS